MIICLGTTPAVQRVMQFTRLELDQVNRAAAVRQGSGGKFINVGKALSRIGAEPLVLGFAGGDRGRFLARELDRLAVPHHFVEVQAETRLCTTLIDQAAGTVTELVEESATAAAEEFERLLAALEEKLPAARALVLSGTVAPGGPPDFYARCSALAARAGVLSVVDAQGPALLGTLETRPAVVKPNKSELEKTLGRALPDEAAIFDAMGELIARGAGGVVVTRGPESVLARSASAMWKVESPRVDALNPIGSGDAFTAGLTAALVWGRGLGEACAMGAAAGAANALTLLPAEITREDFDRLLGQVRVTAIGSR